MKDCAKYELKIQRLWADIDDQNVALECLKEGAQDYLVKGRPGSASIYRAIRYAIERKRMESSLRESELSEKRLALLEQQQEFIATLVHDLRTPIVASQKVFSTVLSGLFGDISHELFDIITIVVHSNESMLAMIDNVLDSYRLESGVNNVACCEVDVSQSIIRSLDELKPVALAKGVDLIHAIDPVSEVRADPYALKRVLNNLVSNAVKFTPSGGTQPSLKSQGSS